MRLRLLSSVLLLVCVGAEADVAPTEYFGLALTPVINSDVRMESETVDIYVGTPLADSMHVRKARVKARFHMVNERPETCHVRVGFPTLAYPLEMENLEKWGIDIYDFAVVVNGVDSVTPVPEEVQGEYMFRTKVDHLWFGWEMDFPPGPTVIDVEYGIISNHTSARCYQNLSYILHTGSYWKGPIDRALVRIHFPEEIDPKWIMNSRTAPGYEIGGNTLTWSFEDFEPDWSDDIHVEFMPPEVYEKIQSLRALLENEPRNVETLVALARVYLESANVKGPESSGYPDFAGMAEPLLREAVALDPSNALAWNTYLSSYFRMHDGTFGPGWQRHYPISEEQRKLIEAARLHCGGDAGVRLWYELTNESAWELPDTMGRMEDNTGSRAFVWIPTSRYGYSEYRFSDEEMKLILSYYDIEGHGFGTHFNRAWLVRNPKTIPSGDRERMIEILRRVFFQRIPNQILLHNRRAGV